MSTKANIIVRHFSHLKREIILYQHTEGHPNHMNLFLTSEMRDLYTEYSEHGDVDWFMNPGRIAGSIIARSVPRVDEDVRAMVKDLPAAMRTRLESSMMLGFPTIIPEIYRTPYGNYEYYITLKEDIENQFFGYQLDVHKLLNGRKVAEVFSNEVNFLTPRSVVKPLVKSVKSDANEVTKVDK